MRHSACMTPRRSGVGLHSAVSTLRKPLVTLRSPAAMSGSWGSSTAAASAARCCCCCWGRGGLPALWSSVPPDTLRLGSSRSDWCTCATASAAAAAAWPSTSPAAPTQTPACAGSPTWCCCGCARWGSMLAGCMGCNTFAPGPRPSSARTGSPTPAAAPSTPGTQDCALHDGRAGDSWACAAAATAAAKRGLPPWAPAAVLCTRWLAPPSSRCMAWPPAAARAGSAVFTASSMPGEMGRATGGMPAGDSEGEGSRPSEGRLPTRASPPAAWCAGEGDSPAAPTAAAASGVALAPAMPGATGSSSGAMGSCTCTSSPPAAPPGWLK
mmetsp:Transcript_14289/g.35331  ORF Transcript_14289/g.35331 Transcript_14289/m.35331 type:complete len:325 (-) Transcript_14289:36-1010(-)